MDSGSGGNWGFRGRSIRSTAPHIPYLEAPIVEFWFSFPYYSEGRKYDETKRSAELHTIAMFARAAKLNSRYFAATHGDAHLKEMPHPIRRLVNLIGHRPDAFFGGLRGRRLE